MSTEQDRETLIAEARNWASGREGWNQYEHDLGYRLADAIEALVKERDNAIRDLDAGFAESDHLSAKYYQRMRDAEKHARMRASESADLERERDELAAVIEKAKLAPVQRVPDAVGLSGTVSDVLREAPADVLREHDAALIESLADRYRSGQLTGMFTGRDGYTQAWLRERARQVREGEA